jgi:hypothetical protein
VTESSAPCGATYTSRDGGSALGCTEPKGHPAGGLAGHGHYAGGLPSRGERGPQAEAENGDPAPSPGWDYDRVLCAQHGCGTYTTPTLYYCRAHYSRTPEAAR